MAKAQAAVEITVLAAILILALMLIFDFSETKLIESASILQVSQARNAVDMLAKAATDVCNEGVGAREKIYITIPNNLNPSKIRIGNNTITLQVYVSNGTTDVSSIVKCPVIKGGFFPTTPGSYWVWVVSRTGYVQIGSAVDVEPPNEYFELFPQNSTNTNIAFSNYGASPVNISSTLTWTDSEVTANINSTNFSLPSGASNSPLLNFNITAKLNASRGLHSGYITITTNTTPTESEVIPVVVNIVEPSSTIVSYITLAIYNDSNHAYPSASFSSSQSIYYMIRTYNSSNSLVNSTVTIRVYNPSSILLYEQNLATTSTGVYSSSYPVPSNAPGGSWQMQVYDVGGASAKTYFTVSFGSDTQAPTFSLNSTNSTKAGASILHSLYWQDNVALSGYIFQFCNGTWNGANCIGNTTNNAIAGFSTIGSTNYPIVSDSVGGTTSHTTGFSGYAYVVGLNTTSAMIASSSGTVQYIGINANSGVGNVRVGIYNDSSHSANVLLGESNSVALGTGWTYVAPSTLPLITAGKAYWSAFQVDSSSANLYYISPGSGTDQYKAQTYGAFSNPYTGGTNDNYAVNMRVNYTQTTGNAKAINITLSNDNANVQNVSFYTHAAGNFRVAIYNSSNGYPYAKLWESGDTAASAATWNNVTISSGTPTSLSLNSGVYWLAWQWANTTNGPSYTAGNSGDGDYINMTYGSFPATFTNGTGNITTNEKWSIYMSYTYSTTSSNWADSSCGYRRQLSFTTPFGTQNLTNFPVLIVLNSSRISYTSTSATDIRFYDSDNTTLLYKETELWNASGSSYIWVKKPSLNNNTQDFIWAYYNCSNTNNDNKNNVWDSNYVGVWHLSQSSGTINDSTVKGNNLTNNGATYNSSSIIGGGYNFDGSSSYLNESSTTFGLSNNLTLEFWANFKTLTSGSYYTVVSDNGYVSGGWGFQRAGDTNKWRLYWGGTDYFDGPNVFSTTGQWTHIVVTVLSGVPTYVYINGAQGSMSRVAGSSSWGISEPRNFSIGRRDNDATQYVNGTIDEVRISNTSRSASWLNASYLTESDQLITYGSEQAKGSGWQNDTWAAFAGSPATGWSNVNKTVTSTVGANVSWCVYANDTSNNWNTTSCTTPFTYVTTTSVDTQAPTFSLNLTNSTNAGTPVLHSLYWQDNVALSGYIFQFCNGTWNGTSCGIFNGTNTGGTATASSEYSPPSCSAFHAFDGDYTAYGWGNNNVMPSWLQYDFGAGNATIVTRYGFIMASGQVGGWGSNNYNPMTWTFNGYNETSGTWTQLDSQNNGTLVMDTWYEFPINNNLAYRKYSINISAAQSGTWVHITEMHLMYPNWQNDTWAAFAGSPGWSNVTKTVTSTVGANVSWCVYANDTSNNWNGTSCVTPFSYKTSNISIPSGIMHYVPITLTNSQTSPVPGSSQVSIPINWNTYSSYLDNPVDNYVFFNSSGTVLYSWLENGTANTATNALAWVKLDANGIPASGNYIIYLGFYALGNSVLSPTGATGEAPQLSGTYAQYDNGNSVFNFYDNFTGTTLNSKWTLWGSVTATANNGLTMTTGGGNGGIVAPVSSGNTTLEAYAYLNYVGVNSGPFIGYGTTSSSSEDQNGYLYWPPNYGIYLDTAGSYSGPVSGTTTVPEAGYHIFGATFATSSQTFAADYTTYWTASDTTYAPSQITQIGYRNNAGTTILAKWVRTRAYPPNGVMPSSSFGTVT